MATIDELADDVVVKVRGTFQSAFDSMHLSPDFWLFSWTSSGDYAKETNAKTMQAIQLQIEKWASTYREWATNGRRDDGSPYSWRQWFDYGLDLTKQAISVSGGAWEDSSWEMARRQSMPIEAATTAIKGTVQAAGEASDWLGKQWDKGAKCVEDPASCVVTIPWWVWAALAGGVGLMVLSRSSFNVNVPRGRRGLSADELHWTEHAKKAFRGGARAAAHHGARAYAHVRARSAAAYKRGIEREYRRLHGG
jgi:hypothetical protein